MATGPDMKRDTSLAGKSVKKGNYTVTYNENGYATKAVKDGGKSATSTVKTTNSNNSTNHQLAYQAAQSGDWDKVGNYINQIAIAGGKNQYGTYDMSEANKYMSELQDEFKYNARDYYGVSGGTSSGSGSYSDSMYQQALAMLQYAQKNAPTYANSYEAQLKDIYDKIVNRDKFQYDINSDMLYQQYKQQYQNNGRLAMQDTMGQAAALTGGYGSSYGQAVGQQQYDAYLQQLNAVIPELYNQAYQKYNDEGDQLLQQYSMLGDLADREYQLYSDAYDRWFAETQSALDQYNNDRNFNYQKEQDALTLNYNKEQADREYQLAVDKFKYQQEQDKIAQQNAAKKYTPKEDKPKEEDNPIVQKTTYTLSELLDATASGMTKAQIEAVLTNRGVNVNNSAVQADIKWALSK